MSDIHFDTTKDCCITLCDSSMLVSSFFPSLKLTGIDATNQQSSYYFSAFPTRPDSTPTVPELEE